MARYDAGETLASIARTYDCSPPAISYVVSRSRDRQPTAPPPAPGTGEPQLIKATAAEPAVGGVKPQSSATAPPASPPPAAAPPIAAPLGTPSAAADGQTRHGEQLPPAVGAANRQSDHRDATRLHQSNGFADTANGHEPPSAGMPARAAPPLTRPPGFAHPGGASGNGDSRHTLHLSLGGTPQRNGAMPAAEPPAAERSLERSVERQEGAGQHQQIAGQSPPQSGPQPAALSRPAAETDTAPHHRPGWHGDGDDGHRRDGGGAFIDKELRARVDGDIAAFLTAFDAALAEDTQASRLALREATDRLLRAGARTRIELERLEARVPLPSRDIGRGQPAWRQR